MLSSKPTLNMRTSFASRSSAWFTNHKTKTDEPTSSTQNATKTKTTLWAVNISRTTSTLLALVKTD